MSVRAKTPSLILMQAQVERSAMLDDRFIKRREDHMIIIIQAGNRVIPLEVKAERNLKAKSLKLFIDTYNPPAAIRSSLVDFGKTNYSGGVIYEIPLYMAGKLLACLGGCKNI